MMRPKTDNSIENGSGNAQIGHNTGEINVGLTFEEHQQALKEALKEKTEDLERAHGAEKDLIRREADELRLRLADVEKDYQDRLEELRELKAELAKYQNRFEQEKFDAANAALDRDDSSLAEALFKELLEASQARHEDAEREEASLHYRLGKIAEDAVRWHDAYTHYKRASELHDTFDYLSAYAHMSWHLAKAQEAIDAQNKVVGWVRSKFGEKSSEYAGQLNNLAILLSAEERYAEAETLNREAIEIGCATIGKEHPNYATRLNNLALVVKEQGRHSEAEELYREVLEIDRATIGERHSDYSIHLNNLAGVVEDQGRYKEAEGLYHEALEITVEAVGEGHPSYAVRLNNLAGVLVKQDKPEEARPLFEQALAIFRATLPPDHPHIGVVEERLAKLP